MSKVNFGKVAVLLGGRSAEREVSLKSGRAVLNALVHQGIDAHPFDPSEHSLEELVRREFDRAFIALHGRFGEDGSIQGALELLGIPYTGSGVLASALAMDKWRTKLIWQAVGISTPRFLVLDGHKEAEEVIDTLGLPLIIKPAREGSTIGLSKIKTLQEFSEAYQLALKHDSIVLAEQFIEGKELTAAILGNKPLPLVRIEVSGDLYDYQAKYLSNDTRYYCPSGLPDDLTEKIQHQALQAHNVLGCYGWSRVDVILDHDHRPFFLEANTSPGMTDHSLVPMAARTAGITFDQLVVQILALTHVE